MQAAVELLTAHGHWLGRRSFTDACVHVDPAGGVAWISWAQARAAYQAGLRGSATELAVLDYAIALGTDRYRLAAMGAANARDLVAATARALGV